jgi:hypothetical protein
MDPMGTIIRNNGFSFQEIFMRFSLKVKEFGLRGIEGKSSKLICSNNTTNLLKRGQYGVIAKLCSLYVQTSKPFIPLC